MIVIIIIIKIVYNKQRYIIKTKLITLNLTKMQKHNSNIIVLSFADKKINNKALCKIYLFTQFRTNKKYIFIRLIIFSKINKIQKKYI